MKYLIDTNVVIELAKKRPDRTVTDWKRSTRTSTHYLSVITVGEIHQGVQALLRRQDTAEAGRLTKRAARIESAYSGRILPVTVDVAHKWGAIGKLRTVEAEDRLIAATALVHGFTVVTRNTKDFRDCGVALINPFKPGP